MKQGTYFIATIIESQVLINLGKDVSHKNYCDLKTQLSARLSGVKTGINGTGIFIDKLFEARENTFVSKWEKSDVKRIAELKKQIGNDIAEPKYNLGDVVEKTQDIRQDVLFALSKNLTKNQISNILSPLGVYPDWKKSKYYNS